MCFKTIRMSQCKQPDSKLKYLTLPHWCTIQNFPTSTIHWKFKASSTLSTAISFYVSISKSGSKPRVSIAEDSIVIKAPRSYSNSKNLPLVSKNSHGHFTTPLLMRAEEIQNRTLCTHHKMVNFKSNNLIFLASEFHTFWQHHESCLLFGATIPDYIDPQPSYFP